MALVTVGVNAMVTVVDAPSSITLTMVNDPMSGAVTDCADRTSPVNAAVVQSPGITIVNGK